MVSQAPVNGQTIEEATTAVGENVFNLTSDLLQLTELQGQMLVLDLKECGTRSLWPGIMLVSGLCLFLGTFPIALAGCVWLLVTQCDLSYGLSILIVSLVSFALSSATMIFAALQMKQAATVLSRSQQELRENMRWIKRVVQQVTR